MNRRVTVAIATLVVAVLAFAVGRRLIVQPSPPLETIRMAVNPEVVSALIYVAAEQGFFRAEGLEVTLQPQVSGKAALASALAGQSDVATTAELPVILAVLNEQPATVFATIEATDTNVSIIARKDAGIKDPADLAGKRIGITPGTNTAYFLDLFLAVHTIDPSGITLVPVSMDDGAEALMAGRIDALSAWTSARVKVQEGMHEAVVSFAGGGIYTELWTLAARPEFLGSRPETVRKLLRALLRAERFAAGNREEAITTVARHVNLERNQVAAVWDNFGFTVSLDQALLVHMEGEARRELKNLPGTRMPNFLDHLSVEGMMAVDANRVTIFH